MQLGNRKELDAARWALIDQLDAVWMAVETKEAEGRKEKRCRHLAICLAHCDYPSNRYNWMIGTGWRGTAPAVLAA